MAFRGLFLSTLLVAALASASFSFQPSDTRKAYASSVAADIEKPFSLKINQTAHIESAGLEMTFVTVKEDSRCPSDVVCVWAGQISIVIDVKSGGNSSQLTLALSGGQSQSRSFGNYSIKLVDVQPYPISTKKNSPSDYLATLVVGPGGQVTSHAVFAIAQASDAAVVAGWNVEKGKGVAVLFMQGDGPKRVIVKFVPSYSSTCSHGPILAECIDGQVTSTSDSIRVKQGENLHVEVDSSKARLFLTLDETGKENILNLTIFKTWSKPIVVGSNSSIVFLQEDQRNGPLLVQKIYPDRVEGLNFPEYPIATDQGFPITLRIGEKASNGCTIMLTLVKIQGGTATFLRTVEENRPCPICWLQAALASGQK